MPIQRHTRQSARKQRIWDRIQQCVSLMPVENNDNDHLNEYFA